MYLTPKSFKCKQCGECCKIVVKLNEKEIKAIKKSGYKDFLAKDPIKGKNIDCLKRINGNCFFFNKKKG